MGKQKKHRPIIYYSTQKNICVCVCWKYWQFNIRNIDIFIYISGTNERCCSKVPNLERYS